MFRDVFVRYWCRLCLKDDCVRSSRRSWPKPAGLMVNSSIFLSRCIFNRKPRWKTFFISVESSLEQKRHRGPWNKFIYAAYSTRGMQCVPNRFQITSFVNVRPSLSAPMHFDLRRRTVFHTAHHARDSNAVNEPRLFDQLPYFQCFLKGRRNYGW